MYAFWIPATTLCDKVLAGMLFDGQHVARSCLPHSLQPVNPQLVGNVFIYATLVETNKKTTQQGPA